MSNKKGWHHTEESKRKIGAANKDRMKDPAIILKINETKRRNGTYHTAAVKGSGDKEKEWYIQDVRIENTGNQEKEWNYKT